MLARAVDTRVFQVAQRMPAEKHFGPADAGVGTAGVGTEFSGVGKDLEMDTHLTWQSEGVAVSDAAQWEVKSNRAYN